MPLHIWLYDQVKLKLEALQEEEKEAEEEEAEEEEALEEAEEEKYDPLPADFRRYSTTTALSEARVPPPLNA